jgi:hypothetical protein
LTKIIYSLLKICFDILFTENLVISSFLPFAPILSRILFESTKALAAVYNPNSSVLFTTIPFFA